MSLEVIERVKELTCKRREAIDASPKAPHKTFKIVYINNEDLGDVPIPVIYKYLYDPNILHEEDPNNKDKTWIFSALLERKDYDVRFENTAENKDKLPSYFANADNQKELFTNFSAEKFGKLLEEFQSYDLFTDYHYYFTHPCKPVFMGPEKVNVHEHYKLHFVSPTNFIVEVFSYCSGFMLMDTFYTVIQYKFESELVPNQDNKSLKFSTKVTVSYDMQFVKVNPFKGKVESEGLKDNREAIEGFWVPRIKATTQLRSQYFYLGKPALNKTVQEKSPEAPVKNEEIKPEVKSHHLQLNLINPYSIAFLFTLIILYLAGIGFHNSLAVVGIAAAGAILYKLEDLGNKISQLEQRIK